VPARSCQRRLALVRARVREPNPSHSHGRSLFRQGPNYRLREWARDLIC
jgi:hypothetical protein